MVLGMIVGKALYEGVLLDVAFAPFFVKQLQGRRPELDDVVSLDPEIHRSLVQVASRIIDCKKFSNWGMGSRLELKFLERIIQ